MPIVSAVERRTPKGRSLLGLIYLLLLLGSVSMVYPFMLMVRLSSADAVDQKRLDPLPTFWWNRDDLARKYLLKRYSNGDAKVAVPYQPDTLGPEWTAMNFSELGHFWKTYYERFDCLPVQAQKRQIRDYLAFLSTLQTKHYVVVDWDVDPDFLSYKDYLERVVGLSKEEISLRYIVKPDANIRDWHPRLDDSYHLSVRYAKWAKPGFRRPVSSAWATYLKTKYGQYDVDKLNKAHRAHYSSWTEVRFPLATPTSPIARSDYRQYIETQFPRMWTRIRGNHQREWTAYLYEKRIRNAQQWRRLTGLETAGIEAIPLTCEMPENEAWATLWSDFIKEKIPIEDRELRSPDRLYVLFLKSRYGSLDKLNAAWSTALPSWGEVRFAEALYDYRAIQDRSMPIQTAMTFGPFRVALKMLGKHSTALINTAILMFLALMAALTVNPLAAYALSRFRIRGTHKILLFILATMALPAEIAMVPSFLLVKNLGLMNNYLALVLPGAASAFGIFLLKGFFDSLPSELFEAATLDGAKETTIFLRITMPLAKPILAVTAMGAVLGAYGTFVPAILYLQNSDMWPLMPRLYEMSTRSDSEVTYAVNMAALVISSLPTLLVFLVAQRQIMRGIIIPTFK